MNLSTVFSLGGALISLLSGTKSPMVLGGVSLDGFDSPEKAPWGGEQKVVTHDLPGGIQVFNVMGFYHRPMEISGVFVGAGAVNKARKLEAITKLGKTTKLTWSDFTRDVLLTNCEIDYTNLGYRIPYKVVCLVVSTNKDTKELNFLEKIGKDITDAIEKSGIAPELANAQKYLAYAKQAIPFIGAISPQLSAKLGGLLNSGNTVISSVQSAAEGNISSLSTAGIALGGLVGGTTATEMSARVLLAKSSTRALAAAVNASSLTNAVSKSNIISKTM